MFLLLLNSGLAQNITGSISGTVKDTSGAVVSDATITVTDIDHNQVVRTIKTDATGYYRASLLPIGHYSVTAEAPGFKKTSTTDIVLHVNDALTINLNLPVGAATQTVTVQADQMQLNLENATSAGLISGTQIRELALNNRNYEQLVALQPGVAYGGGDQLYIGLSNPAGQTNTVSFSISGQRNSANNWTLDGADNVDRGSNLTLLVYPSVDAIAEFKTLRGNYSAEFGRSASGQINVVTKSGTNGLHGSAYEFVRNDIFNANSFFNKTSTPVTPRGLLRYNDFGYTVGGPVLIPKVYDGRDKTFFFFSQEIRRVITYATITNTGVPTAQERQGNFGSALVCDSVNAQGKCKDNGVNQITNISPTAQAYLNDIYSKVPLPNAGAHTLITNQRSVFNENQQLVRIDHHFTSNLSAFFRFINDDIPTQEPGGLFSGSGYPGVQSTSTDAPGRIWLGHVTYAIRPTLLVDGGYSYSRGAIISHPTGLMNKSASPDIQPILPFTSTLARVPSVSFTGAQGLSTFGPYNEYNRNHNVYANLTKQLGQHTLRFGATYYHYEKTENAGGGNAGSFAFSNVGAIPLCNSTSSNQPCTTDSTQVAASYQQSFANFLTGYVSTFSQASLDLTPKLATNQFELYAQDDWKALPRLTLNMGVRYSFFPPPVDGSNMLSTFDPTKYDASQAPTIGSNGLICTTAPCAGGTAPNPNYNKLNGIIINSQNAPAGTASPYGSKIGQTNNLNFAPRFGFAYDVFGNGKTSLRGGYGLAFDTSLFGTYEQNIFQNVPFVNSPSISNTSFDNPASVTPNVNLNPIVLRGTGTKMSTPYTQQYSLDVQTQITPTTLLDVGYVGNHGVHLIGIADINQIQPGLFATTGIISNNVVNSSNTVLLNQLRPYKGYNAINMIEPWFSANYNSLQVAFQKRFSGKSMVDVNYTWSRALTNNQSDRSTAPQNVYDINAEYGRAALDRKHILTADFVYELPFLREQNGLLGHTLGGWEISGIVSMNAGLPLTATTSSVDPGGLGFLGASAAGGRPDMIANPNAGAGRKTLTHWFNTAAFALVPAGQYRPGNERRGTITGPGFQRWDIAAFKNIKVAGSASFQFRAETFNTFNHTNYDSVYTNVVVPSLFGHVLSTRDPRIMQLGAKFLF
ncbi:MAG: carboxypeptidase-like regulatory domain-containing protein [Acidobacteriaceae bacterium]